MSYRLTLSINLCILSAISLLCASSTWAQTMAAPDPQSLQQNARGDRELQSGFFCCFSPCEIFSSSHSYCEEEKGEKRAQLEPMAATRMNLCFKDASIHVVKVPSGTRSMNLLRHLKRLVMLAPLRWLYPSSVSIHSSVATIQKKKKSARFGLGHFGCMCVI